MAVDLVGIQSVQHLNRIFQLNNHNHNHNTNNHEFSVSSSDLKQVVSALKRSGHARFRRAPPPSVSSPAASDDCFLKKSVIDETTSSQLQSTECCLKKSVTDETTLSQLQSTECLKKSVTDETEKLQLPLPIQSVTSSIAGEGSVSVSNGRQLSSLGIVAPAPSFSSRKPPLPSNHRKRHSSDIASSSLSLRRENHSVSGSGCHCCKRRKTGSKREVRRIPIIGSEVESIPADDYSWKKYDEKKVAGSRFPRVYYKCNSVKGCPARKSVELALTDSKMLIVTYAREHRH